MQLPNGQRAFFPPRRPPYVLARWHLCSPRVVISAVHFRGSGSPAVPAFFRFFSGCSIGLRRFGMLGPPSCNMVDRQFI
eukprot:7385720-Prymnesium_polylepis.2